MIEYLAPVVSLVKLVIDGLQTGSGTIKGTRKKDIQRRIIEIQLVLEDIIDKAEKIIASIESLGHKEAVQEPDVKALQHLIYGQDSRIRRLMELLDDDVSEEIMKVFAPVTRRRIWELINIKDGFIREMIGRFHTFDRIALSGQQLMVKGGLEHWDHGQFLQDGHSYSVRLYNSRKKEIAVSSEKGEEQREIIRSLIACSKDLSDFIKGQIRIEDVVVRKRKE